MRKLCTHFAHISFPHTVDLATCAAPLHMLPSCVNRVKNTHQQTDKAMPLLINQEPGPQMRVLCHRCCWVARYQLPAAAPPPARALTTTAGGPPSPSPAACALLLWWRRPAPPWRVNVGGAGLAHASVRREGDPPAHDAGDVRARGLFMQELVLVRGLPHWPGCLTTTSATAAWASLP